MSSKNLLNNTIRLQEALEILNNKATGGVKLPELNNEAIAADLLIGKELINGIGSKVIGTMPNNGAISSTMDGINTKSVTIPQGYTSGGAVALDNTIDDEVSEQADLIAQIAATVDSLPEAESGGVVLPSLSNPASSAHILSGKEAIDSNGNKITGTIATKTVDNLTASGSVITVPSGYYSTNVTKSVTSTTQATPSITVDANGLITAIASQTAGWVTAGSKSATKQLAFQAAKTITPSTTDQVAVSSGYYTGGNITVKGDSNLIAGNIKSGVSIFGITGTLTTGGGSGAPTENYENAILEGTIVNYTNDTLSTLRGYAFYGANALETVSMGACQTVGIVAFSACTSLTTATFPQCTLIASSGFYACRKLKNLSFPNCQSVYYRAFTGCSSLTTIDFPQCTYIGGYAFQNCQKLTTTNLPLVKYVYSSAFQSCKSLATISLPNITVIGSTAFGSCTNLSEIHLMGSSVCTLSNSNAFVSTGITSTTGAIYVPGSLAGSYTTATNWAYFKDIITPINYGGGGSGD